ncbi:Hypothetical predicted protein [Octopus vulgaris]|uniref:Uncharacterized protein n=1 Tax=Octopus vulgaris TaxID=6645 RepID=A0AA36FD87_OCTVU|nr:Hypothetical predicted protein [Octopus vulgaris]
MDLELKGEVKDRRGSCIGWGYGCSRVLMVVYRNGSRNGGVDCVRACVAGSGRCRCYGSDHCVAGSGGGRADVVGGCIGGFDSVLVERILIM